MKTAHERIHSRASAILSGVLLEPLTECRVERRMTRLGDESSLLDQILIGAQGYVFHTNLVYTIFV